MRSKNKGLMEQIKSYAEDYAMHHGGSTPSTSRSKEKRTGSHGNLQHVVRQYYEYKNGRKFPQLREYEKLTGRS